MKKLMLVLSITALVAPPVAGAKGLMGAELCGPEGCQQQLDTKSHLLIRDGQMVALSADTSDRIVRGASLASGSSFPWSPAAAGVAAAVLAAGIVRRLRPRVAPRPVTQT